MSIVFACNGQTGYVVEGLFEDAGDGYAVLTQIGGKEKICDTVEMKNGQFEFKGKTPFVQWVFLKMVPDEKEVVETRFILENNRIKMRGDWNNIGENEEGELAVRGMTVEGSKNYDIYRQFAPFGEGHIKPRFKISRLNINDLKNFIYNKHILYRVNEETSILIFNFDREILEASFIDVFGYISLNTFRNIKSVQLIVDEYKLIY